MESSIERGRRLGRKYTQTAFAVVAGSFVLWTSLQIIEGALGAGAAPVGDVSSPGLPGTCEGGLRGLTGAVERAIAASGGAADGARAASDYGAALSPEWDAERDVEARCGSVERGAAAFAAVVRFKAAGRSLAVRHAGDLEPLRRQVAVYLPPGAVPK